MKRILELLRFVWRLAMPAVIVVIIALFLSLIALPARAAVPERGYRGFLDWSNSLRRDKTYAFADNTFSDLYLIHETSWFTGFSTSHGYQIDNNWFVGLGLGYEQHTKWDLAIVPLFAEGRLDLQLGKATPFADVRLGVNLSDGGGIYFSPTIGYRFSLTRKLALNAGVGLTLRGYKVETYDIVVDPGNGYATAIYSGDEHHVQPNFTFRLGLEF